MRPQGVIDEPVRMSFRVSECDNASECVNIFTSIVPGAAWLSAAPFFGVVHDHGRGRRFIRRLPRRKVLWKVSLNFRLIIFSMVSASYLPSVFSFLCSATTLSFVSSSTQSSRRSTVSGIITQRYCGGRVRAAQEIGDVPDDIAVFFEGFEVFHEWVV